ncbi:MAG: tetratricopeptide repeat protein [Bryobacteraceae bacterium]|nr:tetratricopeptide repeat protein [Bryobacteraceae bacterium]
MNQKIVLLSAGGLCLLLIGGLWLGLERKSAPPSLPAVESAPPPNRAHEKAMLEEQLKRKPGHAPVLLRLAQLAAEDNQPAEARRTLEMLLKADPGQIEARLELGRVCYQLNDLACATAETERILAVQPNHVDALYNLGAISANTGLNDKARQYWNRAVKSAPSSESGKMAAEGLRKLGG